MNSNMPRECAKLRERLPEYADGILTGRPLDRLERHLARCARCAAELEDVSTVIRAVRSVKPDVVPEALLPRVRRAVGELAPKATTLPQFWVRIAVPVAVVIGIVAVSFALLQPAPRRAFAPLPVTTPQVVRETRANSFLPGHPPEPNMPPATAEISKPILRLPRATTQAFLPPSRPPEPSAQAAPAAKTKEMRQPAPGGPSAERGLQMRFGGGFGGAGGPAGPPGPPEPAPPRFRPYPPRSGEPVCPVRERESAVAGFGEEIAPPPSPPFSAMLALVRQGDTPAIALHIAAEQALEEIAVHLGPAPARQLLWRGSVPAAAPIVLSTEHTGPGPAAIPVTIESAGTKREYLLFVPTMARLGESAATAPRGRYDGELLSRVLADFSALTGLILLAEQPLSMKVVGEIPPGTPDVSLAQIAASAGFEVHQEGDLVFTLTHGR